jgi:hypothetical protein
MKPLIKNVFAVIAMFGVVVIVQRSFGQPGMNICAAVIAALFIFSIIVRKKFSFKSFFVSKYNLLSTKYRRTQEFDFPKDLLFEKLVEVLESAGFKIIYTNKITGDIFATSSLSLSSWGENIYITLKEHNEQTTMDFCSSTFFQIISWGKNERNYERMFNEFENSLIV